MSLVVFLIVVTLVIVCVKRKTCKALQTKQVYIPDQELETILHHPNQDTVDRMFHEHDQDESNTNQPQTTARTI